jgi:SNF2 family DNA or RNA helicase
MKWAPKPWQFDAMKFLVSNDSGGLFYDMGLGKTAICLGAMQALRARGFIKRTLVVAPIRTLYTVWPAEMQKWAELRGMRYANLHEHPELRTDLGFDVYGINPEQVAKLLDQPDRVPFDHLIVDESSLFKSHAALRFKAVKKHLAQFSRRWILTGTPAPNGYTDLWSQIFILDGGHALGHNITAFRQAFCRPPEWGEYDYVLLPGAPEEIEKRIAKLVLRRGVGDGGIEMPELLRNRLTVRLPASARAAYRSMEREFYVKLGDETVLSPSAATAAGRCRQIASGSLYLSSGEVQTLHEAKLDALAELLDTHVGRPILCFYEFAHEAEAVRRRFGAPSLTGEARPDHLIGDFTAGKLPLLLAHPSTGGYGLNLQQSCRDVVFLTPPWDLAGYEQGIARVWRQGQQSGVTVHHIVAQDTLDEVVMEVLTAKGATQQGLLEAIKRHGTLETRQPQPYTLVHQP